MSGFAAPKPPDTTTNTLPASWDVVTLLAQMFGRVASLEARVKQLESDYYALQAQLITLKTKPPKP